MAVFAALNSSGEVSDDHPDHQLIATLRHLTAGSPRNLVLGEFTSKFDGIGTIESATDRLFQVISPEARSPNPHPPTYDAAGAYESFKGM